MKPPENVLFVCKLNPVTNDEDLETIFSRFGEILSCEIVRDKKTGDSLCYAFIEFENEEDAEKAFFKMDNVLIDDRRIHVDFSQSVAKAKWEYDKKQRRLKAMKAKEEQQPRKATHAVSSSSSSRDYKSDHKYHREKNYDRDRHRDYAREKDRHHRDRDYAREKDHHHRDRDRDRHYRDRDRRHRDRSRS